MPADNTIQKPITTTLLSRRRSIPAKGKSKPARVTLLDVSTAGLKSPRLVKRSGRVLVEAALSADGLKRQRRYEQIPVTRLTPGMIRPELAKADVPGFRPAGVNTTFKPKLARPTHQLRPARGEDTDPGGTIFGTDNRYLFDDRNFPWRTTGKVRTVGKWGSGTTIGPRHVLTASHVVNWTGGSRGGVAWMTFTPGYFDGSGPWGEIAATRVIYWQQAPSSLTDQQTAFDYVVLIMAERIGERIGYPGFRTYSDSWNGGGYWQYIGYPGELSSGERPAFQGSGIVSSVANHGLSGQTGSVMGHFNEFTPGQSGGAIWGWWGSEPWPRVVGVGSTIGSTAVQTPTGSTTGDNEYGGGPALSALIAWARSNYP